MGVKLIVEVEIELRDQDATQQRAELVVLELLLGESPSSPPVSVGIKRGTWRGHQRLGELLGLVEAPCLR